MVLMLGHGPGLCLTTHRGNALAHARPVRDPSLRCDLVVVFMRSFKCSLSLSLSLSLSRWKTVGVYLWRCDRNLSQILCDYQR